jgi:SAM-dependent methyltransferase
MKGFVPTPPALVDRMLDKLFAITPPGADSTLLDPGCGSGAFIEGVVRWCDRRGAPLPKVTGVDSDPARVREAKAALGHLPQITIQHSDFLVARCDRFDYIIGNPPYVPITGLDSAERERYRREYRVASGRFDLYQLFFEQALRLLNPAGRLVFVTPEKFLYVQTARTLRRQLARSVEEIELVDEATFPGLITYPAVTTVSNATIRPGARVVLRDGTTRRADLDDTGASWLPAIGGQPVVESRYTLADAFTRISCGVATGADGIFVLRDEDVPTALREFAHPTLAGRDLAPGEVPVARHQMLVPYNGDGSLLSERQLGPLARYLANPSRRARLTRRTCVARKPWYAFHENPPLEEIRRPKILCKDIGRRPWFFVDESGEIIPRHSLYYLVPADASAIHELCDYLNSAAVSQFLMAHCQRAANGFVRLQSHVLRNVPLPDHFASASQLALA